MDFTDYNIGLNFLHKWLWKTQESYEPLVITYGNDRLEVSKELMIKEHFDRVEKVLKYYKIEYQRVGNTQLMLEKSISRELIWNIASKAEDSYWLETHKVM